MSYIPKEYRDDEEPYLESANLNHSEQGIVLAVSMATEAKTNADLVKGAYDRGELNGKDGDRGLKGDKGDPFKIDGEVANLADLPDPTALIGQIWLTNQFGHLHYSDGTQWLDWW